jgi:CheY-like chemotaxis protein
VIFMDHLMPGMDGFQAVQAIKNNPRTATIPILMYTSQEGELYLGQARALGAVGVLPKQIRPADVSIVLHQLHLAEDRRDPSRAASFDGEERRAGQVAPAPVHGVEPQSAGPGEDAAEYEVPAPIAATASRPVLPAYWEVTALREEVGELRRLVVTGIDGQTERLLGQVRQIVADAQQASDAAHTTRDRRGTLLALAATVAAIVLAVLWLRGEVERRSLQMQVAQLSSARIALVAESAGASPAESTAAPAPAADEGRRGVAPSSPGVFLVPFGEPPLGGARVERLRSLLAQLAGSGFQGSVDVQSFPGRFCLAGNASDGYSLAADATPTSQCELIGSPGEETAQRESLPFANMVAEFRKAHGATITVNFTTGSADQMQRFYPDAGARTVTAGEWNAAASLNNRVEVRWRPRS